MADKPPELLKTETLNQLEAISKSLKGVAHDLAVPAARRELIEENAEQIDSITARFCNSG